MRRIIFLIVFIFVGVSYTNAQTVTVPQEFLTSATKSFREVRTLRTLVDAQKAENAALQKALDAKTAETLAKDNLIQVQNERDRLRIDAISSLTEQNKALAKLKCEKTILLFGLIKKVSCR